MSKFLVTYDATISRPEPAKADADGYRETVVEYHPLQLRYYMVIDAVNHEAASDLVVNYKTPGFVSMMTSVVELGEGLTAGELEELLKPSLVLKELK